MTGSHSLYLMLVLEAVLLGVVSSQTCDGGVGGPSETGSRIWTIATGHDWGAHEYFDQEGYINGFSSDIINAVCDAAGMDCRIVWDKYTNCWDSAAGTHPTPGKGLMGRWYDACTGWGITLERMHAYDFTLPYLAPPVTYFYVKTENRDTFNVNDLSGYTIAFFDGWYSDEKCLARQSNDERTGYVLNAGQIVHVPGPSDVVEKLVGNQVNAVFAGEQDMSTYEADGTVVKINTKFYCVIGGHAMMTRKDSDFATYWNRGFQKLRSTGQFHKLCRAANEAHGAQGPVNCVE